VNALDLANILAQLRAYRSYLLSPNCGAEEFTGMNLSNMNSIFVVTKALIQLNIEVTNEQCSEVPTGKEA
jgi:hypothetical protein